MKPFLAGFLVLSFLNLAIAQTDNRTENRSDESSTVESASVAVPKHLDSCFAPHEPCDKKIIAFINSAKKSLNIAIYSITHPEIAAAILDAKNRGIEIRMVVDRTQSQGNASLVPMLKEAGIALKTAVGGVMHHKFTVVDEKALQTGSYNYTRNATFQNAENQIYLTSVKIVERYQEDFERLWEKGF